VDQQANLPWHARLVSPGWVLVAVVAAFFFGLFAGYGVSADLVAR
jgi:hypothetical protein